MEAKPTDLTRGDCSLVALGGGGEGFVKNSLGRARGIERGARVRRACSASASQSSSQRHEGHEAVDLGRLGGAVPCCGRVLFCGGRGVALVDSASNHLLRHVGWACIVH